MSPNHEIKLDIGAP